MISYHHFLLQIAKELGSDKCRFASSPEGWSIIPSFDDVPIAPSRRNPLPTATAATSPVKRKEPPEENLDDSEGGRRRTKSTSEWWKVGKNEGEQQQDIVGGGGHVSTTAVAAAAAAAAGPLEDEDEDIDIMTGAVPQIKVKNTPLNLDTIGKEDENLEKKETGKNDASASGISRAPGAAMEVEDGKQPDAPVAEPIKKESPKGPADAGKLEPAVDVAEKLITAIADDDKIKRKKDSTLPAATPKETVDPPPPPVEVSQPSAVAPVPAPAPKGFVIPKRKSSAGKQPGAPAAPPAPAGAAAGGSREASAHRNIKTFNGTKDNGDLRRPSHVPTNTDLTTAGRSPLRKQPWQNMLRDIHGAFAR